MNKIWFADLVQKIGQAAVADAFGITPAAVYKAVKTDRKILVIVNEDGSYAGWELRPFPHHKAGEGSTSEVGSEQVMQAMGCGLV